MSLRCPNSPHKTPSSPDGKGWTFTEASTGVVFRSHSLDALQMSVSKHRFAMAGKDIKVDLAWGWALRWLHDVTLQNPSAPSCDNPMSPDFEPPHVTQGRALWKELHQKAEQDADPYELRSWFDRWFERVPDVSGCACRSNALQVLNSMSPDFSREGFKDYCVRFHNEINRRLSKPQWPYESS